MTSTSVYGNGFKQPNPTLAPREVGPTPGMPWTISAIARHLGRDRQTIRGYLNGEKTPGQRRQAPDAFAPFLDYCRQRLAGDPHLWATTLFDEIIALDYQGGCSTFTWALRRYDVRPHCEPCQTTKGRDVAIIAQPPGEEIQFDWLELPIPPDEWAVGEHAPARRRSAAFRSVGAKHGCDHVVQSVLGHPGRQQVDGLVNMAESFGSAVVDELGQPV
ncbi:transcriptional regulator [Streptomyces sp. NPDC058231]|uniref:transcriptional regulator n=1 Tax=Streptomyces sp. NPDC058231 TaxID=3346392 RepID=UPI0036ECEC6C